MASKNTDKSDSAPAGNRKSRLGRGLSSLMQLDDEAAPPSKPVLRSTPPAAEAVKEAEPDYRTGVLRQLKPADIVPNPHQPRRVFGPVALAELAASLKVNGVIQPLFVRPLDDGKYELIAGERRLRAAKLAELETVPCLVRHVERAAQAEMALVENIHREDLNPIDRAEAYRDLQRQLGMTQAQLAGRLGEERTSVANYLRLLDLPGEVVELARDGKLPLGHAKVLAGVDDRDLQLKLAKLAVAENLSVRQLEKMTASKPGSAGQSEAQVRATYLNRLAETLTKAVGTPCTVAAAGKGGYKLTLTLKNAEQFDQLMERLKVQTES